MDNSPFNNPFDKDEPINSPAAFDQSDMGPLDDGSSNRRVVWILAGVILAGCCAIFAMAFFYFQPNAKSLVDQYFPSPTSTPSPTFTPTATLTPTQTPSPTPTLNFTATARAMNATDTAVAYQATVTSMAEAWDVAMTDSFDSNKNDWLIEKDSSDEYATTTYEIKDGIYQWTATAHKPYIGWVRVNDEQYSDLFLSVDIRQASGPSTGDYGLILREDDNSNFYYFGITNDGQYTFLLYYNDWITLRDWTFTKLIVPDEINKIAVLAQGSQFVFFINDQYLFEITNDKIAKGQVALAVELAQEDDQAVFEFDNILIQTPK